MKKILFIWASLLPFLCFAQNAHITFNKTYGGNDTMNMLAQAVVPVDSGYLVFGGYSALTHRAIYAQKISQEGNLVRINKLDTAALGDFTSVSVIEFGGQVFKDVDHILVVYEKNQDVCLLKLSLNGDTLWSKVYPQIGWELGKMMAKTPDNGYIIGGMQANTAQDTVRGYVLRIDSAGNFLWDKTYTMGNDARFFSIQATPWDGGYILGGMGYTPATGYDMFVVKTDSIGDTLWTRRYGGQYWDCGATIVPLTTLAEYNAGSPVEYLLSGCWRDVSDAYIAKLYIAKLDSEGDIIWQKKHHNYTYFGSIQTPLFVRSNHSIIGVSSFFNNYGRPNPVIVSFKSNGDIDWLKPITLNPTKDCYIKDMRPTADGGYVLAGYQYDTPQTAWVMKVDSLGNTCSFVGCDSTIYTGYPIGLDEVLLNKAAFSIVPNPAQDVVTIVFANEIATNTTFTIYDINGKATTSVAVSKATQQLNLNISQLASGIYYCRLANSAGIEKLVIIGK